MISVLLCVSNLFSPYPIDPVYLLGLTEGSDIIVYGCIQKKKEVRFEDTGDYTQVTIIADEEIKKGLPSSSIIHVLYTPHMICPEPPTYNVGEKVIAFLKKSKNGYVTVALSYGVKYVDKNTAYRYLSSIGNLLHDTQGADEEEKRQIRLDWLLANLGDPQLKYYSQAELELYMALALGSKKPRFGFTSLIDLNEITFIQRSKLVNYVIEHGEDIINSNWYRYIYQSKDKDFLPYVLDQMEYECSRSHYWIVLRMLNQLKHEDTSGSLQELIGKWESCLSDKDYQKEILIMARSFIRTVRERYNLPSNANELIAKRNLKQKRRLVKYRMKFRY